MKHYIKKRRDTVPIRLSTEWHRQIKMKASRDRTTMAKILDLACRRFFERPEDEQSDNLILNDRDPQFDWYRR